MVYTEYVKQCQKQENDGVPETVIPKDVASALGTELKKHLRRRGLMSTSASNFDYAGRSFRDPDTFNELLQDAYQFAFYGVGEQAGKHRRYLYMQVNAGNCVDGLIKDRLRIFVQSLHQNAFPKDLAVYKNVRKAAIMLLSNYKPSDGMHYPDVKIVSGDPRKIKITTVIGFDGDFNAPANIEEITGSFNQSTIWEKAFGIVEKISKKAAIAVADGTLESMNQGVRPMLLNNLKNAIRVKRYSFAESTPDESELEYASGGDQEPTFVRVFRDENRFEYQQRAIDELFATATSRIQNASLSTGKKNTLTAILEAYRDQCRHLRPGESITQTQIRKELGIPRATMSDYMNVLEELLEGFTNEE